MEVKQEIRGCKTKKEGMNSGGHKCKERALKNILRWGQKNKGGTKKEGKKGCK